MEKPDFPESALLLDIGARETVAVFAGRERIIHIRHFPFGGESVTAAMAEAMGIGLPEAEAMKRSGEIGPEASAHPGAVRADFSPS